MVAAEREVRQAALDRYKAERNWYEQLAGQVAAEVRRLAGSQSIPCLVTARAKDVFSFSKKIVTKGYADPWREITDKAGVRATALYIRDVPRLRDLLIARYPDPLEIKDFSENLAPQEMAYQGIHVTVQVPPDAGSDTSVAVPCEVQLRTFAQGAWAEVSHHLLYKHESEVPQNVVRALYRLVALMEVFDAEVGRAMSEIIALSEYAPSRLLTFAEEEYYRHRSDDFDRSLSLIVLKDVAATITDIESYGSVLKSFAMENAARIDALLQQYVDDPSVPLLTQPEAIVLFERLEVAPEALEEAWLSLPLDLLEDVRAAWGYDVY